MTAGPRGPTAGPDSTAADPAAPASALHVGRLLFTPELLIRLTRGRFEIIGDALPDDARWCSIAYDVERAAVSLVVEHESFPATRPGDVLPILQGPIVRTLESDGAPATVVPSVATLAAILRAMHADPVREAGGFAPDGYATWFEWEAAFVCARLAEASAAGEVP